MLKPILAALLTVLLGSSVYAQRPMKPIFDENKRQTSNNRSNQSNRNLESVLDFGDTPAIGFSGTFGGSSYDIATDIVSDASGNVYVCGYFSGNITVEDTPVSSIGHADGFIAKYNSSGEFQWWNVFDAQVGGYVKPLSLILDASENLVLAGTFDGTLDLGIDDPISSVGNESIFYTKISSSGSFLSNNSYHTGMRSNQLVINMEEDSENLYILLDYARYDSYFLAYDNTDELIFEQSHDEAFTDFIIHGTDIYLSGELDGSDNGVFNNSVSVVVNSSTYRNALLAKLDLSGNFQWATLIDHEKEEGIYSGSSSAYDVTLGINDELILSGKVQSYGAFDDFTMEESGVFFAEFDNTGAFQSLTTSLEDIQFNPFQLITNGSSGYIEYSEDRYQARDSDLILDYVLELDCDLTSVFVNANDKILRSGAINEKIFFRQEVQTTHVADFEYVIDGNSAESAILSVESDDSGNIYYYGYTTNTLVAFGQSVNAGYFLAKVNANEETQWVRNLQTDFDDFEKIKGIGDAMIINKSGSHLYMLAPFVGSLTLPDLDDLSAHVNGSTALIKIDNQGTLSNAWKEDVIADTPDLSVDINDNVIYSGVSWDAEEIGGVVLEYRGSGDGFVVKYNSSGIAQWTKQIGGTNIEYSTFTDVDADGNIYITGEYLSSDIFLNSSKIESAVDGAGNVFLMKLNSSGEYQWSKMLGGDKDANIDDESYTWPTGIAVDADGNTYIKGWMGKTAYFDDYKLNYGDYNHHHFISKLDSSGDVLWVDAIEQTEAYGLDYNEMTLDVLGNVYFAIQVKGQIKFGNGLFYSPQSGYSDLHITKYTSDGRFGWLKVIKGGELRSQIYGLSIVGTNKICVGGEFTDEIKLGNQTKTAQQEFSGFYATMDISNESPTFTSESSMNIESGVKYTYDIKTEDKDALPTLSISTVDLPSWLTLTDHGDGTATLEGTPGVNDLDDQEISLYVSDAVVTNPTKQAFTLTKKEESQVTEVVETETKTWLFPNPSENKLTISANRQIDATSIAIVNSSGKKMNLSDKAVRIFGKEAHIDVSNLNAGIYILRFESDSDLISKTFIKK